MATALREVEPVCAGLCAERADRATSVLPRLRAAHHAAAAAVDDLPAYTAESRRFHEELVAGCGNQSLVVLFGGLETLCSADAAAWIAGGIAGPIAERDYRLAAVDDHAEILACITAGDGGAAEVAARRHAQGRSARG